MSKAVKRVRALTIKDLAERIERENKEFNKMTKAQKRVKIAEDCLDRIYTSQIKPKTGALIQGESIGGKNFYSEDGVDLSVKDTINNNENVFSCQACAKGGLFLSYIGRVNSKNFDELTPDHHIDGKQMVALTKIFSIRQLELMELFFEGVSYSLYDDRELCPRISTSIDFSQTLLKRVGSLVGIRQGKSGKIKGDLEKMIYICDNLIENKGTFKI
tara:strand:+ start:171 stop:818 length:648 start_codon:yes stop_codon:yes gene_type:complete